MYPARDFFVAFTDLDLHKLLVTVLVAALTSCIFQIVTVSSRYTSIVSGLNVELDRKTEECARLKSVSDAVLEPKKEAAFEKEKLAAANKKIESKILFDMVTTGDNADAKVLNAIDMSHGACLGHYVYVAGKESFRLIAHMSNQLAHDDEVVHLGASGNTELFVTALMVNPYVRVASYNPCITKIADDVLLRAKCIVLDILEDGSGSNRILFHRNILQRLRDIGYVGVVIMDCIHKYWFDGHFPETWSHIKETKMNMTHVGHWTGTGVILFE
jgi:hypothetical protein